MNSLKLDEYISKASIPELLDLIKQLISELYIRYMDEAE